MNKLVMFDLDGTVLDTEEDLLIGANELFDRLGYPRVDRARIKLANGKDAYSYMRTLMGDSVSMDEIKRAWDEYLKLLAEIGICKTKVFDGLEEVLSEFDKRGYILTILTNKAENELPAFAEKFLKKLPFDEIIGVGGTEDAKPAPNAILKLLKKYNIQKENAFMVGDGELDILSAINADVNPVAVLWGNRTQEQLAEVGAKIFASEPRELIDIIG